ncbi:MAG: hypothetical protein E7587_01175 [Ruminococcaceae bacterium]|nr:hypothetical protein [Oscillospiraceae bacterium]
MENRTTGIVISVKKHWYFKVSAKPFRKHALDGATFPHTVTVKYCVNGKEYVKKKWLRACIPCPSVNETLTVIYDEEMPEKIRLDITPELDTAQLHKAVSVLSVLSSLSVIALSLLQLFEVWTRAIDLCVPLMGVMMLCQAHLHWNKSRKVAYFSIGTAVFIFACAIAVLFLK